MKFLYLLAFVLMVMTISCSPNKKRSSDSRSLTATIGSDGSFSFKARNSLYHGFSWTTAQVPENKGMAFLEQGTKQAYEQNQARKGAFPSNMAGGFGIYFAQDPFVSWSYGESLIAVQLNTETLSVMAHSSDADFPGGPQLHFIPALLSRAPIFHYYWRSGNAFVLRDASVVARADVFSLRSIPFKPFRELPALESISLETLPSFIRQYGTWVQAFASLTTNQNEQYRNWRPSDPLPADTMKVIWAWEKTGGKPPSYQQIESITPEELKENSSPENEKKAAIIFSAVMKFRQELDRNWQQTWQETSMDPRRNCSKLTKKIESEKPIYGYSYEDMDSPRVRTILLESGTHSAEVKSRNGDVAMIKTDDGLEGFSYLSDWECAKN